MNIPGHAGLTLGMVYGLGYLADAMAARGRGLAGSQGSRLSALWARAQALPVSVRQMGMDLRLVIFGALLPDIIDKPLGFWLLPDAVNHATRSVGHTLLFSALLLAAALARLGLTRRAGLLTIALASIGHLLLDQMWQLPVTLLWPFLGWQFPRGTTTLEEWILFHYRGALRSPDELTGALILAWFLAQLYRQRAIMRFLRTGKTE
jgi:inner membrane protein